MTKIMVRPEQLQALSGQLQQAAGQLRDLESRLEQAIGHLDWQVRQKEGVEGSVTDAHSRVGGLAEQADTWSRMLAAKAEAFLQAEQASVAALTAFAGGAGAAAAGAAAGGAIGGAAGAAAGAAGAAAGAGAAGAMGATAAPPAASGHSDSVLSVPYGKGVPPTSTERWKPVDPPVTSTPAERADMDAQARRQRYDQVLSQFDVERNPRYRRDANTYCNIFVSDATRAMGAEVPHWVMPDGSPVAPGTKGAHELDANATVNWLEKHGPDYGWRPATAQEAQAIANDGHPAVVVMEKPGAIGHVAMVRPGDYSEANGPATANVGAHNLSRDTVQHGFGTKQVQYFVHG